MRRSSSKKNRTIQKTIVPHSDPSLYQKPDPVWQAPCSGNVLSATQVQTWRGWLSQPVWRVQQLALSLSADEHARAERFRFDRDRERFIVARGMLRSILGGYLGIEPSQVQFWYGQQGKPYLQEDSNQALIRFSVAHSHQLAVYALACAREVGIDLEFARPMSRVPQTATAFMSARELDQLSALPADQQLEAFYLCWTRKEAYIKARGIGLVQPLECLDVSMAPGEPPCLLRVEGDPGETHRWSLLSFTPAPGYVAALAVEGHGWDIVHCDFASRPPAAARSMLTSNETTTGD